MFAEQWSAREQDIAQEWIQRDSEKKCLGQLFGCCPFSCYRRMTILCYYVTFFILGVLTTAVLVVMALIILQPFKEPLNYTESECTTYEMNYDDLPMLCSCGDNCSSQYPCARVYVRFLTTEGENHTSMLKDSLNPESCTYTPSCLKDKDENKRRVEEYVKNYGELGIQLPCIYDPADTGNVIRKHEEEPILPIYTLAYPAVVILLCALGFFMIYHVCGCRYVCHLTPPEDIIAEAAANPLVATELTPAGIVITEVPVNQAAGDGTSQVPLVENNKEEA